MATVGCDCDSYSPLYPPSFPMVASGTFAFPRFLRTAFYPIHGVYAWFHHFTAETLAVPTN